MKCNARTRYVVVILVGIALCIGMGCPEPQILNTSRQAAMPSWLPVSQQVQFWQDVHKLMQAHNMSAQEAARLVAAHYERQRAAAACVRTAAQQASRAPCSTAISGAATNLAIAGAALSVSWATIVYGGRTDFAAQCRLPNDGQNSSFTVSAVACHGYYPTTEYRRRRREGGSGVVGPDLTSQPTWLAELGSLETWPNTFKSFDQLRHDKDHWSNILAQLGADGGSGSTATLTVPCRCDITVDLEDEDDGEDDGGDDGGDDDGSGGML